jgi:hypothetical protein
MATESQHCAPPHLTAATHNILVQCLVDQQLAAAHTRALQNINDFGEELDGIHRARELEMAEMARAGVIRLAATPARLSIVQNTHTRIKETSNARLISIIGTCVCDFYHRTTLNLFWAENAKLNSYDWFNV